ncbi:MAG: patatin-like phospholipase family protein [Verrucomicrobiales bacterium]|nr:patatin-like phospholipase family protein [Verrucomicrobiota bacterium JB025]
MTAPADPTRTPHSTPAPAPDPARCALVLGSSFLGVYAHTGFLAGLHEADFSPARIAGSSAGAFAGGLHAAGLRGDPLRTTLLAPVMRHAFLDAGALWRLPGILTTLWSSGLFTGDRLVRHLRNTLGDIDLRDTPLDIAVTNADTARTEIHRSGPLAELIMASCAVPGLFTARNIGPHRYLDGGISAELPYHHLIDDPAIQTIVIHRIRHQKSPAPPANLTIKHVIAATHRNSCREFHAIRSNLARAAGKSIIELTTTTPPPGLLSRRHDAGNFHLGLQSARRFLAGSIHG